jgi:hypothetical protein
MAQWLSKLLLMSAMVLSGVLYAQEQERVNEKDYKDPEQFDKFNKRRKVIGAWQINQLKNGALIVRLQSLKMLTENLNRQGNERLALEKEAEQYLINKNIMRAFINYYNFSKVYFMLSPYSDSLMAGKRSGIFLDSNLTVDPAIEMKEPFYLIAEKDYVYNSSIGFVPEDSAKIVRESGNPGVERAVVVKNKYGHQLKTPFPYHTNDKTTSDPLLFSKGTPVMYKGKSYLIRLGPQSTYYKMAEYVESFNDALKGFYQSNPNPEQSKYYADAKPFLY